MLSILASHNDDIRHLIDKGYAVSIDSNHLVIRDVFYLDEQKTLKRGAIVSKLVFLDNKHVKLHDHQIFFCGSHPCELNGKPIANLGGGPSTITMTSPDLKVERSFSNKPDQGFIDLFEKIESYVSIISGPAIDLYNVNPYTFGTQENTSSSVFKVRDTLTSRAEIGDLAQLFKDDVIAIIGLGGSGAYTLDFIAKTPVKEIRGFDGDWYHAHTAFRSPGKLDADTELGKKKAEIYQQRYEEFRSGVNIYAKYISAESQRELEGVTFAFVCVDKGPARQEIFDLLMKMRIPFIDVGMGLDRQTGPISGSIRTTHFSVENAQPMVNKRLVPFSDIPNDEYKSNIQIAELNALNACLAVLKFKQFKGFYADDSKMDHILFTLDSFSIARE